MPKFFTSLLFFVSIAFLIVLGLAISLQSVFGINIGNVLNLQGFKITNVGTPTLAGDAATKGFVDSVAAALQTRVSGTCPAGQGIRVVNTDGTVACETVASSDVIFEKFGVFTFGTYVPADGLWHDFAPFTIPANSAGWAGSYFGVWSYCVGCSTLLGMKVVCDGVDEYTLSFNTGPLSCVSGQGGRIDYHSATIPGTGSVRNCVHRWQAGIAFSGPQVTLDGRIYTARLAP